MKATVYYIDLTEEMVKEINAPTDGPNGGWTSPAGLAYLNAKEGKIGLMNFDLLVPVATLEDPTDAEEVWTKLQNFETNWVERLDVAALRGKNERSMDVGDLIIWEDGKRETVAGCGFKTVEGIVL